MSELYDVIMPSKARLIMQQIAQKTEKKAISIDFVQCNDRIVAENIYAAEDLPGFARSTMDGYAVRAKDIYGATEGMPVYLNCLGEIMMGEDPKFSLAENECSRIWTGGMLPQGADAVVMIEHTQIFSESMVEVYKQCAPGENIISYNEDIKRGSLLFEKGHLLRSQDIGCLAALGITIVTVYQKLKVGIISTGDEIIPPEITPNFGQIRDVNSYALLCSMNHAYLEPVIFGRVGDDAEDLRKILIQALEEFDCVLISGGSSVGIRDNTLNILGSIAKSEIYFHGVSVRPGKPTILATVNGKPVIGLPGPPASAFIIFDFFVMEFLQKLSGISFITNKSVIDAKSAVNIPSIPGREDYVRVKLKQNEGNLIVEPVYGKSAMISSLIKSDGIIKISENKEGIHQGETVKVYLYGR